MFQDLRHSLRNIRQAPGFSLVMILTLALGASLGVLGGWAASHWLQSFVFGVSSRDPGLMLAAVGVVIAVAALAASAPIWRATKTDPVRYLHEA
jgi:ABC-type antimicrobial peptide transport system permease subunit